LDGVSDIHKQVLDLGLCQKECSTNSCGCGSYGDCIDTCRDSPSEDVFSEICANFNLCAGPATVHQSWGRRLGFGLGLV